MCRDQGGSGGDHGDEHEQQLKMKVEYGEALNNDDGHMKTILKIMMRMSDQRENQAKVYPKVNSPVTQNYVLICKDLGCIFS